MLVSTPRGTLMAEQVEFSSEDETENETLARSELDQFNQAVLWGTDWTVETVLAQIERGNIEINPQFQRRDAWSKLTKSRFIESIILGLPVPQVVLAELKDQRGRYVILDGKQRLLSLMQFAGLAQDSPNNGFALSALEIKTDLIRRRYKNLKDKAEYQSDLNAFQTHTIRAVVIRNWPSMSFLHIVFQRLNTGSLKLSPQELRQALAPGPFTKFADDYAVGSNRLHGLLGRTSPDPRMRDTELLVRYISFQIFLPDYAGRMKEFIDQCCISLNETWAQRSGNVTSLVDKFEEIIETLEGIFGNGGVARKSGSSLFNRSIFDALAYFATDDAVRLAMKTDPPGVQRAYAAAIGNLEFQEAVESDTAGIPHTFDRLRIWGECLQNELGIVVAIPTRVENAEGQTRLAP